MDFMTFSQQGKEGARVKALYGHPQMSAFHLACMWKSGFHHLTLNDLILSEGSCLVAGCCSTAPTPGVGVRGGGARRWPPNQFSCSGWGLVVKVLWKPSQTSLLAALQQEPFTGLFSGSLVPEALTGNTNHCFFHRPQRDPFMDRPSLSPFWKFPPRTDLPWPWRGNRWWPLGEWVVFKAALSLGCPWNRR